MSDDAISAIAAKIDNIGQPEQEQPVEAQQPEEEVTELTADDTHQEATPNEGQEATEADIKNIASLAEAIEVEPEYIYGMEVPMGEGQPPVKLGELKDQYQNAIRDKTQLEQQLQQQREQLQQAEQGVNASQQLSQAEINAQAHIVALQQQWDKTNWQELETNDPGSAALYQNKLRQAHQDAQAQLNQATQQRQQYKQQNLVNEEHKLLDMVPEWKDPTVRKQEQDELKEYLLSQGVNAQQVAGISDALTVKLTRKLMLLEKQAAAGAAAVKKVHQAPKVLRGSGRFQKSNRPDVAKLRENVQNASPGQRSKTETEAVKQILGLK